jgi:hypothetical protein
VTRTQTEALGRFKVRTWVYIPQPFTHWARDVLSVLQSGPFPLVYQELGNAPDGTDWE